MSSASTSVPQLSNKKRGTSSNKQDQAAIHRSPGKPAGTRQLQGQVKKPSWKGQDQQGPELKCCSQAGWPPLPHHSRDGPEHRQPLGAKERGCTACWCLQGPDMMQQSRKNCYHLHVVFMSPLPQILVSRRSRISLYVHLEGCIAGLRVPRISIASELQYYY